MTFSENSSISGIQLYSSIVGHDYDAHPFCGGMGHYYTIPEEVEAHRAFVQREGNNGGDCFIKNYNEFMRLSQTIPNLKYVIKDVIYLKSGNRLRHAVIQDGDITYDVSQGQRMRCDRHAFENRETMPQKVLGHKVFDINNIPDLDFILKHFGYYAVIPVNHPWMTQGDFKVKGNWELAKDSIINL